MISKAPSPGRVKNISYPEIPSVQLENGLQVLLVKDHSFPRVTIKLAIPVGRAASPDDSLALITLAANLIKEGTTSRSAQQISDLMDRLAIQYDSGVFMEYCLFSMKALLAHAETAMELLADLLQNSTFPEEELARVKIRWRSSLIAQRSQPEFLANEQTFHALYPNHSYSKVSIPAQHLEKADRQAVQDVFSRFFVPAGALLVLAGPLELNEAGRLASRFFGDWNPPNAPPMLYGELARQKGRKVYLVHRPHSIQSTITVSTYALPKNHPDSLVLKLANQALGGGASARLFLNLREDKGYTYGAYSLLKSYRYSGVFAASANVKREATLECILEIFSELERMSSATPAEDELNRCRSELIGSFVRQMQTPESISVLEIVRRLYGLPEDYYQNFIPGIRSVEPAMVAELSRQLFEGQDLAITVVGDQDQVEDQLREIGPVHVYDILGNQL
ncbi:MAG: M16 family metallopeptidase [Acidobacteriota bacterium]